MYFYIKLNDGAFRIVNDSNIPRVDITCVDKFKKYKVLIDGNSFDAVILFF